MSLARRVASRWVAHQLQLSQRTSVPSWVFARFATREAYADVPTDAEAFVVAKESVTILLPKVLELLRRKMHERYTLNASQRRNEIFYYFAAEDPIESFAMHFAIRGGKVLVDFSYVPFGAVSGRPDYSKAVEAKALAEDPELAGMAVLRAVRQVLGQL